MLEKRKTLQEMSVYEIIETLDKKRLKPLFAKLEQLENEKFFDFKGEGLAEKAKELVDLAMPAVKKRYTDANQMMDDLFFLNAIRKDELARGILMSDHIKNAFFTAQDMYADDDVAGSMFIDGLKAKLDRVKKEIGTNDWDSLPSEEVEKHFSKTPQQILQESEDTTYDIPGGDFENSLNSLDPYEDAKPKKEGEDGNSKSVS